MRIDERLRESVARHGARAAVVGTRGRHSFAELDLKSERLAVALQGGDVAPGGSVAIFMDDGWESVVSIFAVLKAGGILVPIDAATTADVLSGTLNACQPVAIITQSRLAGTVAAAIAPLRSVKLVVLAGGDRARAGGTCISFEEVVGRVGRMPPLMAATGDTDPAALIGGEVPLSHRQMAEEAAGIAVSDDAIVLPPLAERPGLVRLVAAMAAGRTVVARSRFPREEEACRRLAELPRGEAGLDVSGLLGSMVGGAPAFQR
jgi:long-chain acyl-CoA synthetase